MFFLEWIVRGNAGRIVYYALICNEIILALVVCLIHRVAGIKCKMTLNNNIIFSNKIMTRLLLTIFILFSESSFGQSFENDFVNAAIDRTTHEVHYDGSYFLIPYPNGDVPSNIGVCTDVVIRAYRAIGTDLQKLVHEDMAQNFSQYPSKRIWGLKSPDKNIDHRRVPNLQTYFSRHGVILAISSNKKDYAAGDIVTWMLPGYLPHIGIVTNKISSSTGNPLIAHNIGAGPNLDDMLFNYKITGHYRYVPKKYNDTSNATL
jgi:uncharacterized protein